VEGLTLLGHTKIHGNEKEGGREKELAAKKMWVKRRGALVSRLVAKGKGMPKGSKQAEFEKKRTRGESVWARKQIWAARRGSRLREG